MVGQFIRSTGFTIAAVISIVGASWFLLAMDLVLGLVVVIGVTTVLLLTQVVTPRISRHTEHQKATVHESPGVATALALGIPVPQATATYPVAAARCRAIEQAA